MYLRAPRPGANRTRGLAMIHHQHILTLVLALATAPAFAAGQDIDKINGSITVAAGQSQGDLATVNGSIEVGDNARIDEATTVNGRIRIGAGAQVDGDLSTVNGSVRTGEQATVGGDVAVVNGEVFIGRGGQVGGDVSAVNGSVGLVDADIAGDIQMVSGDLTVGVGSHVRGGIHYDEPGFQWFGFGGGDDPRVVIGPSARVDGALVFEREVDLYVHDSAQIGAVSGATAVRYEGERAPRE